MTAISIRKAVEADWVGIEPPVRSAAGNPRDIRWPRFLVVEGRAAPPSASSRSGPTGTARASSPRGWSARGSGDGVPAANFRAQLAEESGPLYLRCGEGWAPYYEKFGFRRIPRPGWPQTFAGSTL